MRILFIADVHGNYEALRALLAASPAFDLLVCLGDIVGYYPQVNEVATELRERNAITLRGNHDDMLLCGDIATQSEAVRFGLEAARDLLLPEHLAWLATLPPRLELELGAKNILIVHGSPWKPLDEYIYPDSPKLPEIAALPFDIIAWGHTHREVLRYEPGPRLLINPGSVGQSRSQRGRACAALVCTETFATTALAVPYDPTPVIAACAARGAGNWVPVSLAAAP